MTKIRYLDEEIQAVKDMYSRGFRIKDISVALNTQFHNGEEVRTYLGVKDCIKRNKIRSDKRHNLLVQILCGVNSYLTQPRSSIEVIQPKMEV